MELVELILYPLSGFVLTLGVMEVSWRMGLRSKKARLGRAIEIEVR
jgi:hypothetical protein